MKYIGRAQAHPLSSGRLGQGRLKMSLFLSGHCSWNSWIPMEHAV